MKTQQTPTLYTMPAPEVLSAEAKAESKGESVVLALCEMCGQPNAQWVVAQQQMIINEWSSECMIRGKKIRSLEAHKAILESKIDQLHKAALMAKSGGDEDGFWWFVLHLLALIAVFGLGWVMSSAVGV